MRVLFIYPSTAWKSYNHGIAVLSAVLNNAGHITALEFVHNWRKTTQNCISFRIQEFKPDLIAISSVTNQFERTKQIVGHIIKFNIPIIIGGVHTTIAPEEAIKLEGIFGICIGEGEYALLELVEALEKKKDYRNIKNWWFKSGGKIIKNPIRPLIQDLDSLPFADYDILDHQKIINEFGVLQIFANRGCPYQCTYCVNHTLMKLYTGKGKLVRFRKVKNLIEELIILKQKFENIKTIEFFDDTFILNQNWLKEFAELYPKQIGIPFRCNARANLVNPEIISLLKKAGCYMVNMAIETGNEQLRMNILNKKITNMQLILAFKRLREAGIKTYAHNMVGLPYETVGNIKESIALNKQAKVNDLQCWVFCPYPGTKLYEVCKHNNWISNRKITNVTDLNIESILDQPSISKEDVFYYHCVFKSEVLEPNSFKSYFFRFIAKHKLLVETYLFSKKRLINIFPHQVIRFIRNVF